VSSWPALARNRVEFEGVPNDESGETWLRTWGERAAAFARDRLAGERVTIRTDSDADRRGGYGRLLVYVVHDNIHFNRLLLEGGYARLYDTPFGKRDAYASAERTARENGTGLWGYNSSGGTE